MEKEDTKFSGSASATGNREPPRLSVSHLGDGYSNVTDVSGDGDSNVTDVSGDGYSNVTDVSGDGDSNVIDVSGDGDSNVIDMSGDGDSNVTDVSGDAAAATLLQETYICLPDSSLPEMHEHYSETQDKICLDENSREGTVDTKQSHETDLQQINEKSVPQVDDERLLNIIESADPHQAVQLLEGNNHFSQDGLDRALISACRHGLKYLVQTLVRLGANVQFNTQGNTPLLICAENGFIDIVHFLLKKKADVNAFNSAGDTALILSIRAAGSLEMVRVLLEQEGIDISHQNQDGYTALMKAVEVGDVDVMKVLMERYNEEEENGDLGPDSNPGSVKRIDAVNLMGMTAEQIADECGFGNIYHILKTHLSTTVSPLVTAIEERDTYSLNILLNSHFVDKHDIEAAFVKIDKIFVKKKKESFTASERTLIKRLLECGINMDTAGHTGFDLLLIAVKMGDCDLVESLCRGLNQNWQNISHYGSQALIAAAGAGRCDLINILLKYQADINNNNEYNGSPLDSALRNGHHESAKLLFQHGAKIDIQSALRPGIVTNLRLYMNFIFENYQREVFSYATKNGPYGLVVLLYHAARFGNLEIIGHLLDVGADVNFETKQGTIPLGESKDGDIARFLLSRGANVNLPLYGGGNPLQTILFFRHPYDSSTMEIVKVLLESGASVNAIGRESYTPLMVAVDTKNGVGMLQLLLDHGADINAQDSQGNTVLMHAVFGRSPLNVSFLLDLYKKNNLNPNVQNHKGQTALMSAVMCDCPTIVQQLVNFGVDVNTKDVNGNTPLLLATDKRYLAREEIVTTLILAGSDVNSQNNDGLSPLMQAVTSGRKEALSILLNAGANVNAVSEKYADETALTLLSYCWPFNSDFNGFLPILLSKGANAAYADRGFLQRVIVFDAVIIPQLIQCGLGPEDVEQKDVAYNIVDNNPIQQLSPLCVALLVGNVSLARYFVGNMFLTSSDVTSLTGSKILRGVLERNERLDCLPFLDELSSRPWSLLQLAFVSVSSAVGSSPGRENRVEMLPLPQVMKDKLLFKSHKVQRNAATQDKDYFEQERFAIILSFCYSDGADSDDYTGSDGYMEVNDSLRNSSDSD